MMHTLVNRHLGQALERAQWDMAEVTQRLAESACNLEEKIELGEVRATLESSAKRFVGSVLASVTKNLQDPPRGDAGAGGGIESLDSSRLELVANDRLEDWLVASGVADKAEGRHRQVLADLEHQLTVLYARAIDRRNNPLGPRLLAEAFREAMEILGLPLAVRRELYRVLETQVLAGLDVLYRDLVEMLESNGLPRHPAQRPVPQVLFRETPAAVARSRTKDLVSHGAYSPPPSSSAAGDESSRLPTLYEAARRLLHMGAEGVDAGETSLDRGLDESETRYYELDDLMLALSRLQPGHGMPLPQQLEQQLVGVAGSDGVPRQVLSQHREVAEAVRELLVAVERDELMLPEAKCWVRRFEVPLLKAALIDDAVFESRDHPTHVILNLLDQLSAVAPVREAPAYKSLWSAVDETMERLSDDFATDPSVLADTSNKLSTLAERVRAEYARNIERLIATCEGQHRRREAERAVILEVDRRLRGRRIPKALLGLIDDVWRDVLKLAYTREGPAGADWQRGLKLVEELVAAYEERRCGVVQALLAEISKSLETAGLPAWQCESAVRKLDAFCSSISADGAHAEPGMDAIVYQPTSLDQDEKSGKEMPRELAGAMTRGEWIGCREHVAQLEIGDWVAEDSGAGRIQPLQLAWVAPDRSRYVLANRIGMKAADLNAEELVLALHRGRIQVLQGMNTVLVERASRNMLQSAYDRIAGVAGKDDLTGLLNRREFEKHLDLAIRRARSERSEHVLCYLDLAQFRLVNNSLGHDAGDRLLQSIASFVDEQAGHEHISARVGDDDFAILMEHCGLSAGERVAQRLRQEIESFRFDWQGKHVRIAAGIGLVSITNATDGVANAMAAADTACRSGKLQRHNPIQVFTPDDPAFLQHRRTLELASRVDEMIEAGSLLLRCQRIEPLAPKTGRRPHYEVLLGIGDGGDVSPVEFIAAAEAYGRMAAVDRWVVEKALSWMQDHFSVWNRLEGLSVNLSGESMNDKELPGFIEDQFARTGVPPERVCFEVTETATISNLRSAGTLIRAIKEFGCRFALDDFGSGLSSYGYLKKLPVDFLKIDGSLVRDIASSDRDFAMVRSINEIGHVMGLETIAEYVEDDAIRERLAAIGIDYAQGYGVEKPRLLVELP
jgi:diguanylate cyclase (GGDEF)-like protein